MRHAERQFAPLPSARSDTAGNGSDRPAEKPRLIIVGNAPVLTRGPLHPWIGPREMADFIDSSDCVIRMNVPVNYERPGAGSRTDILALIPIEDFATRTLIPADIRGGIDEIWFVRPDGRGSAQQSPLQRAEKGLWPTHWSDSIVEFQGWQNKRTRFFDAHLQHDLARRLRTGEGLFRSPSTGICAIEMALHDPRFAGHDIYVVGFRFQGWHMHPFAAERARVFGLIAEGRLRTLAEAGLPRNLAFNAYDAIAITPRLVFHLLRRLRTRIWEPRGLLDRPAN